MLHFTCLSNSASVDMLIAMDGASRSQTSVLCTVFLRCCREMENAVLRLNTADELAQAIALGRNPRPLCEHLLLW